MSKKLNNCCYESAGWMLAECCCILDNDGDPRKELVPEMMIRMEEDLKKEQKSNEVNNKKE